MRHYTLTLNRLNDRGKRSTRYRWEVFWSEERSLALVVERYGFKGEKSFAWTKRPNSELMEFLRSRFQRFNWNQNTDELISEINSTTYEELPKLFEAWRAGNTDDAFAKKWDEALAYFQMSKLSSGNKLDMEGISNSFYELCSQYMVIIRLKDAENSAAPKAVQEIIDDKRVVNWGAW